MTVNFIYYVEPIFYLILEIILRLVTFWAIHLVTKLLWKRRDIKLWQIVDMSIWYLLRYQCFWTQVNQSTIGSKYLRNDKSSARSLVSEKVCSYTVTFAVKTYTEAKLGVLPKCLEYFRKMTPCKLQFLQRLNDK